jgi:phosphomannomutase
MRKQRSSSKEVAVADPFKAYDVRGIYGEKLTDELAHKVGRAFVAHTGARRVTVGYDMRESSPNLKSSLIDGLTEAGADVIDIGLASTDMLYFAVIHQETEGGIMVTASHNPAEYNGMKCTRESAIPLGLGSGLEKIEQRVRAGDLGPKAGQPGKVEEADILSDFVEVAHSMVDPPSLKPMKVVVDAGNGMGGLVMPKLFAGTPIEVIPLFFELDGSFPNHEANPLVEKNRRDLVAKVKEVGADLGIGLDGDVDRAFFVDGKGEFCSGDFILGLLAQPVLKRKPGALITYDVRCSRYVRDTVERMGGRSMMWKVGHAYAKNFMRENNADFGGEVSGHYYFQHKGAYFDSGSLTSLFLLRTLSDKDATLSEAMAETKDYHISGEINSRVKNPDEVLERVKDVFAPRGRDIIEIDGVSVVGDDWWLNVRKSNTEPLVRLNCEAHSHRAMEKLRDETLEVIRQE